MLGRILGRHSEIHTFGELHFFEQQIDTSIINSNPKWSNKKLTMLLERLFTSSRDGFFAQITPRKYQPEIKSILDITKNNSPITAYKNFLYFESQNNNKSIPCEQTPRYLFSANEILAVFPEALIINMIRDPRDVLLSQKNKWRRRFLGAKNIPLSEALRAWMNYHPYTISRLWVSAFHASQRLKNNNRFVSIRFEDILKSPEHEIQKLSDFLEIKFEDNMLNVPQIGSSTGIDKPDKKGIDSGRTATWVKGGLSNVEISICQHVAAREMESLGYKINSTKVLSWRKYASMFVFVVKISVSILMNIRRSKNIFQSIRRRLIASPQEKV